MMEFNFQPAHQELLNDYLNSRSNGAEAMTLDTVQGFLFAIVCSPDGIEPEQWLSEVTGADENVTEEVVFAFLALHHHVSEQVFTSGFKLPFEENADWSVMHQWSLGFLLGCQSYLSVLSQANISEELKEALISTTELLGFFSLELEQVEAYCQSTGIELEAFRKAQYELAAQVAPAFADLIEQIAVESGLYEE
ncbi:YecA family protein [Pseudoalteromonas luteoviolacea]|uniref:YecA/YgfB family protein n=1 Tax=Pseudoalteromonas luteoviolacea TaxID=43657 RepID=UPI00114EDB97|nr:YecA family protein [Pseudoalteromonas luteoviolacea]TQF72996.1 YecA family protein [Pseudoalteromonas luteoviolacea]